MFLLNPVYICCFHKHVLDVRGRQAHVHKLSATGVHVVVSIEKILLPGRADTKLICQQFALEPAIPVSFVGFQYYAGVMENAEETLEQHKIATQSLIVVLEVPL